MLSSPVFPFVSAFLLLATPAAAAGTEGPDAPAATESPGTAPADPPPRPDLAKEHAVSFTFSPLHLLFPELKVMVEGRLHRKVGVAVLGGYGSIPTSGTPSRFDVWEAGAQARYYLIGTFDHGMELGAEAEYLGVSTSASSGNVTVLGAGSGFVAGPFVGYKLATSVGFTIDLQGGIGYEVATATAQSSTGQSASGSANAWVPLLNLHLGWSF